MERGGDRNVRSSRRGKRSTLAITGHVIHVGGMDVAGR